MSIHLEHASNNNNSENDGNDIFFFASANALALNRETFISKEA